LEDGATSQYPAWAAKTFNIDRLHDMPRRHITFFDKLSTKSVDKIVDHLPPL
jgi:hypothetical protein